ncbi:MAG: hypothetical protein O3A47_12910, partial [Chloroflexi bacterium]|nr:hypothetical protein [Chloroflexota bacterium]
MDQKDPAEHTAQPLPYVEDLLIPEMAKYAEELLNDLEDILATVSARLPERSSRKKKAELFLREFYAVAGDWWLGPEQDNERPGVLEFVCDRLFKGRDIRVDASYRVEEYEPGVIDSSSVVDLWPDRPASMLNRSPGTRHPGQLKLVTYFDLRLGHRHEKVQCRMRRILPECCWHRITPITEETLRSDDLLDALVSAYLYESAAHGHKNSVQILSGLFKGALERYSLDFFRANPWVTRLAIGQSGVLTDATRYLHGIIAGDDPRAMLKCILAGAEIEPILSQSWGHVLHLNVTERIPKFTWAFLLLAGDLESRATRGEISLAHATDLTRIAYAGMLSAYNPLNMLGLETLPRDVDDLNAQRTYQIN